MEKVSSILKEKIKRFSRKKFYFNKRKICLALKSMMLNEKDFNFYFTNLCSSNEINNLCLIFSFLNCYQGDNILDEFNIFYSTLCNASFKKEFYIYFFKSYYYSDGKESLRKFKNNIDELFYGLEAEAFFSAEKFRCHFKKCYLDNITTSNELDVNLLKVVGDFLPKKDLSELEVAIALYIILCRVVSYSSDYIINHNINNIPKFYEVNDLNNEVICITFAIIYYKLLKMYNIDANLSGDFFTHMKVELRINSMMLSADGTFFGFNQMKKDCYNISDLGNVKFGFSLTGFYLESVYYTDLSYIKYNKEKLYNAILNVNRMLDINNEKAIMIGNILYDYEIELRRLKKNSADVTLEEIDYRMNTLNRIYGFKLKDCICENKQFLSKFKHRILGDISLRDILLYKDDVNGFELFNLYIIDLNGNLLYYFEDGRAFKRYDYEEIKELINSYNLLFKNEDDKTFFESVSVQKKIFKN